MNYSLLYHPLVLKEDIPPLNKDIKNRIKISIAVGFYHLNKLNRYCFGYVYIHLLIIL